MEKTTNKSYIKPHRTGGLFSSVGTKIIVLASGCAFFSAVLIGSFFYNRTTQIIFDNKISELSNDTHLIAPLFQAAFDDMRYDALVLARTPPVKGIIRSSKNGGIDPVDGSTTDLWKQRMTTIFRSMVSSKLNYVQIRYIGLADDGRELIRVNRSGQTIDVVEEDALQPKGDEPYFMKGMQGLPYSVYFSVISLNREHGKIQEPYVPVIRAVVPIYDDDTNKPFGAIVINASLERVLQHVTRNKRTDRNLYIINELGEYIVQRKNAPQLEFHFENNVQPTPIVNEVLTSTDRENLTTTTLDERDHTLHFLKLFFDPMNTDRFIAIALSQPQEELLAEAIQTKKRALFLTVLLVLLSSICAAILSYFLSRPLKQMIAEMRRFGQGKRELDLPVTLQDEIGELARTFDGLAVDLAESRQSERHTLAKLQAILDNTVDGLITIDERGTVEGYNKSCEDIFGYRADEVIGRNIHMLMPEPYRSNHDDYLKNYQKTGQKKIIGIGREVEGQRKDGSIFPLDLSVSEVKMGDRTLYSGIVRDITDRKAAEEEILRSNAELERFAYVASHDLQEPLRMVTNFTQLLEKRYSDALDDTAKEYIDYAAGGARRMQDLVSDLLEYARIGQEAEHYKETDMNVLMSSVMDNLKDGIDASSADIHYESLPVVMGNPIRLTRLVQNLIGNAIKYQHDGIPPVIHISAVDKQDCFQIAISDNGIGMKQEYCEKIFEPFKRLHGKNEYTGTGMGLAICRRIIEGLGGEIWAESELGKGSRFYFTIPKRKYRES